MVVLLGQSDQLVGITEPRFLSDAAVEEVGALPRLPGGPVSAEAIALMRPTLVLGTDVVAEQQPSLGAELEAMGIAVWFVDPDGLDGLWQTMAVLGERLGAQQAAEDWVATSKRALPAPVSGEPISVFFYDCCDPPFTAGGRAPASELLERMGARNVFADQAQDWLTVSWEAVAEADPDLIIVHDYPWQGQADTDAKLTLLRDNPLAARTRAVQELSLIHI